MLALCLAYECTGVEAEYSQDKNSTAQTHRTTARNDLGHDIKRSEKQLRRGEAGASAPGSM
jgi:autotransporter adhesin